MRELRTKWIRWSWIDLWQKVGHLLFHSFHSFLSILFFPSLPSCLLFLCDRGSFPEVSYSQLFSPNLFHNFISHLRSIAFALTKDFQAKEQQEAILHDSAIELLFQYHQLLSFLFHLSSWTFLQFVWVSSPHFQYGAWRTTVITVWSSALLLGWSRWMRWSWYLVWCLAYLIYWLYYKLALIMQSDCRE